MKNKFFLLLFIIFPSLLLAQKPLQFIDYNFFINAIKENNPIAKKAINTGMYAKQNVLAARGNYDPMLDANYSNKFFNTKNYYSVAHVEIKQPIFTSQYIKLGYEYGQGAFINPEERTSSYGLPFLGIEASLLQGLLFDKRRAEVLKSKAMYNFYTAEQQVLINDLLFESASSYLELLFYKRQNNLQEYFLNLANQRFNAIVQLANFGERPSIDTIEAAVLVQARQIEVFSVDVQLQKQKNMLSAFLATNKMNIINDNFFTSDSLDIYYNAAKKIFAVELKTDTLQNPLLKQYNAKQDALDVEKKLRKEMIKPKLDVSYNFLGNNNNTPVNVISTNNYKWGASLSFPLFVRNANSEYKMAKIIAANNNLEFINKYNELKTKLNYYKENNVVIDKQVFAAQQSLNYNKLMVEAELLKFNNGESSLFLLNTRENKWLESNLKLIELQLKYIKNTLYIKYLEGNFSYNL